MKDKPFENILNFRDVGKTINEFTGEKLVAEGKIFRSARPDDATLSDRKRLKEEYGIKTIMDLRTVTEHVNQAKKRSSDLKIPALLQSNSALAEPVKVPGMKYLEINVNGKGFERSLLWRLKFWSFIKLITLMLFGYRMRAISILGREVMLPRGLIGLGYDSLDACGPEIAECLLAFTSSQTPILIHCTQGKDRTGLIVALLLLILKVPLDAIGHDYVMSERELDSEKEARMVEIRSIGLSEEFATCPAEWVGCMERHLRERYGGLGKYLRGIGVSEEMEGEVVKNLGVGV
ncbi:tyrosine/serine protein phosphatase-like protein [Leptodontidium sp. MPI-SDFR-AT-0119]|nr:tyrosine/serine protein phosphatase-like protein [Leptodontidium sp. MPI-SDFR-AT-0119]